MLNHIGTLLRKEFLIEWRQRYILNGVLLYTISTVFICYLAFGLGSIRMNPITWNTLFWIIVLFSAINTVAKSFLQESRNRDIYYYTVASPQVVICAKIIYSTVLMMAVTVLALIVYMVLLGNPVNDLMMFIVVIILGALGFSSTLTMISSVASKAGNSGMLMAVLSFPVLIPLTIMVIRASKNAMDGLDRSMSVDEISVLLALNVIVVVMSLLLYPYLSKN